MVAAVDRLGAAARGARISFRGRTLTGNARVVLLSSAQALFPGFSLGPVDLEIISPGLTAISGPSGSGKSTLLALLAGHRPASSGTVRLADTDLEPLSDRRRARLRRKTVAFASQTPTFIEELSILRNLLFAGADRARVEAMMAVLEIEHIRDRAPEACSGGELVRAGIARALASPATAVCLDEPTAMLDDASAARVRAVLVRESGSRAVVAATHDAELMAHAGRNVILAAGKIRADGIR